MRTALLPVFILAAALAAGPASAQIPLLYGGNGGHPPSTNNGWLVLVDQTNAAVTPVGPTSADRLSGLAFDAAGDLFGATQVAGGFPPPPGPTSVSDLIRINPGTGALLSNIGPITDGGTPINIADLAVQPGTDTLFGIRGPQDQLGGQGKLYTINKQTGVATLVGDTGFFFGSIAFAPNGTLYLTSASLGPMGPATPGLNTVDPTNAHILSSVATTDFFAAFGIRPTDGVLFGGTGDSGLLATIDPLTGGETMVGSTGLNFIGDLDFLVVPEPGTLSLLACMGLSGGAFVLRRRLRKSK